MIEFFNVCARCSKRKHWSLFPKCTVYRQGKGISSPCKKCIAVYSKNYRQKNKERIIIQRKIYNATHEKQKKITARKYTQSHKKQVNTRLRKYRKERYKIDHKFRLTRNFSGAVRSSIKSNKNGRRWELLVGYTLKTLKSHLEKQFTMDMTWENYGEWQIDHKVPIKAFNFQSPEHNDFRKCWALSNLQPMWKTLNVKKGAALEHHFQPSLLL